MKRYRSLSREFLGGGTADSDSAAEAPGDPPEVGGWRAWRSTTEILWPSASRLCSRPAR